MSLRLSSRLPWRPLSLKQNRARRPGVRRRLRPPLKRSPQPQPLRRPRPRPRQRHPLRRRPRLHLNPQRRNRRRLLSQPQLQPMRRLQPARTRRLASRLPASLRPLKPHLLRRRQNQRLCSLPRSTMPSRSWSIRWTAPRSGCQASAPPTIRSRNCATRSTASSRRRRKPPTRSGRDKTISIAS